MSNTADRIIDVGDTPEAASFPVQPYAIDERMQARIENTFVYHRPFGDQGDRYDAIRRKGREFAMFLCHVTPPGREQSIAITDLESVIMRANQAIALGETAPEV